MLSDHVCACVIVSTTGWNLPQTLAVVLRSDPGRRQEALVLRRGHGAQTGGHGEQALNAATAGTAGTTLL